MSCVRVDPVAFDAPFDDEGLIFREELDVLERALTYGLAGPVSGVDVV
jgi:hypothetical protein